MPSPPSPSSSIATSGRSLSDNCYQCHGPDAAKRKADLRLDLGIVGQGRSRRPPRDRPGRPEASELYRRITAADADERMPPAEVRQVPHTRPRSRCIRRWIAEGAKWQPHWAFIPPQRPADPRGRTTGVGPQPDRRLRPGPPGARRARAVARGRRGILIRRVTLDLTGLPPTLAEDRCLRARPAPDAYEKVVDRLLASPRYGERMAIRWLDAARYADTNGYQTDGRAIMWRWRDWVIDAFNRNMPFDRFTIEQLAGDLLPNATLDQKIATGFNRNHRGNGEGGIIPEEYRGRIRQSTASRRRRPSGSA